jgi:hypothetical protein
MDLIQPNDTPEDALLAVGDVICFVNEAMTGIIAGEQGKPSDAALHGMCRVLDACDHTIKRIVSSKGE